MKNNALPLNVNEIIQIANTIASFFDLKIKMIEFGDKSCYLKCYENKVYDKVNITICIVFNKEYIIADLYRGQNHQSAIFKEAFEHGENIYSLTVKNCGIYYQGQYFYKKQDNGIFVRYVNEKEEKYVDSENKNDKKFKCKNDCIKKELF